MGYNVVGRAIQAGLIREADRWTVAGRVISDSAYAAQLEDSIAVAIRTRAPATRAEWHAPDFDDDFAEFDQLFPPRTPEELDRRLDAEDREQARLAASALDDHAFDALFGPGFEG